MGFREGLAAVLEAGHWGFIDQKGEFAIPPVFDAVRSFSDGRALVRAGARSGFIDKTGALRIPLDFDKAEPFSDGLAVVGDLETGYIYIDTTGQQAIPERFAVASRFLHGVAHVKMGKPDPDGSFHEGNFAYIDRTGKHIFRYRR